MPPPRFIMEETRSENTETDGSDTPSAPDLPDTGPRFPDSLVFCKNELKQTLEELKSELQRQVEAWKAEKRNFMGILARDVGKIEDVQQTRLLDNTPFHAVVAEVSADARSAMASFHGDVKGTTAECIARVKLAASNPM
jgi:hypothetical protein